MTADNLHRAHRQNVLASLRKSRAFFLDIGEAGHAAHLEHGILLLLDHRISETMLNRISLGAMIAARAAACVEDVVKAAGSRATAG